MRRTGVGIGERTFRRWCGRYREGGEANLLDRRLGQEADNRVPAAEAARVEARYRERYARFTAKHFHEHLVREHAFRWGYTWTKTSSKAVNSSATCTGHP